MKFISLGIINIKFLIPVLGGLFTLIFNVFIVYNPKNRIIDENPFLQSIFIALGMSLAFIPFLIIINKSKTANKIYNEQLIKSELYNKLKDKKNVIKKTKYKKYRFICYSAIFDFLETLLEALFSQYFVYNLWIFDIIFISLFSFLFLKTKYYKHQFISMISIVILGLGLNIITYFKYVNIDDTEDKLNILNLFIQFISEIFYSLIIIFWKYNMEKNYCNPYELCFLEGVFEFIINSICLIIFCRFEFEKIFQ